MSDLSGPVGDTQPGEFNDAPVITSFRDFAIYDAYGVSATPVGDDGQWVALGHVEPLRMLAAMRAIGHTDLRLNDEEIFGYTSPADGPLTACVQHGRGLFTADSEEGWFVHFSGKAQAHPAAVDITVFEA